jgi:hypothetical protein
VQDEDDPHSIVSIMKRVGKSENRAWYASKLDGIGAHASKTQNERFDLAVSYLETHCKKLGDGGKEVVDRERVLEQLNSIDFHKPVELNEMKPGRKMRQYSDGRQGEYFTDPGVPEGRVGITVKGREHRDPVVREEMNARNVRKEMSPRIANDYTVKKEMVVLKTHTRGTVDTWSSERNGRSPVTAERLEKSGKKIETGISNKDEEKANVKLTHDAKLATRKYSRTTDEAGESKITHKSGEFVRAGGAQYHVPQMKDEKLRHKCRHQNLVPCSKTPKIRR